MVYGTLNNDGQSVVVDEKEGKRYDSIIFINEGGCMVFSSSDRFYYLARKGKDVYLVEESTTNSI